MATIFWTQPSCKISKYFTVKDALYLPRWQKMYLPSKEEMASILKMAEVMDKIRDFVKAPINVHCWTRSLSYNKLVGGAEHSMHLHGLAVDWDCGGDCDHTRQFILPMLPVWNVRMEDLPKSNWVHIDMRPVNHDSERFFKP
jgi:uncharacterized protein YcbK (DUF882 family)